MKYNPITLVVDAAINVIRSIAYVIFIIYWMGGLAIGAVMEWWRDRR